MQKVAERQCLFLEIIRKVVCSSSVKYLYTLSFLAFENAVYPKPTSTFSKGQISVKAFSNQYVYLHHLPAWDSRFREG